MFVSGACQSKGSIPNLVQDKHDAVGLRRRHGCYGIEYISAWFSISLSIDNIFMMHLMIRVWRKGTQQAMVQGVAGMLGC